MWRPLGIIVFKMALFRKHVFSNIRLLQCIEIQKCGLYKVVQKGNLTAEEIEKERHSPLNPRQEKPKRKLYDEDASAEFRGAHPEFLPHPDWHKRDRISEKLARKDMFRRRYKMDIPEFYVGSILAVTASDELAAGKSVRFVGICIQRGGCELYAHFTLRTVMYGQGVEIRYDLYNPLIQSIEVLKLEKRLDDELLYLRDAPRQYSMIRQDFKKIPHPEGSRVPINRIKVPLRPRPWLIRWERQENIKGIQMPELKEKLLVAARFKSKPWEKYDLMKKYRGSVPPDDVENIYKEVYHKKKELDSYRRSELVEKGDEELWDY